MSDSPVNTTESAIASAVERVWGYDSLRPLQRAAIQAGVQGLDCLTVLPTGGGKSLCYQVPPLVTDKATIVVSPLIALMRDQVRGLELNGYAAAALHSNVELDDQRQVAHALVKGELNLVLAAPERILTPGFLTLIDQLVKLERLGNIAIDEAHCISQWGHDFRPEYRRIAEVRQRAPGVPIQAFTATATPRVRDDIIEQLGLRDPEVLVGTFDRPNLTYRVQARRSAAEQTNDAVRRHQQAGDGGGTIVYCLSRKDTEELAQQLRDLNLNARAYHAGLEPTKRHKVEQDFTNEHLDIVVATVAFGMGIDRSNVRLVVHACMPKSIEAYQQETGRAGRDGLDAECLLLYSPSDGSRWERLIKRSADESGSDPETVQAQLALIRDMRRLVTAGACRHKLLSEHFGQTYATPTGRHTCGACDICLGETETDPDSTRTAQVLLSAIARTDQRYGAAHICDIARGHDSERIRNAGHHELSVFGMLNNRRKQELMVAVDQLVASDALQRIIDGHFETLRFGPKGTAVMKGEEPILFAYPVGTGTKRSERKRRPWTAAEAAPLSHDDKQIFESLRAVRKHLAEERRVPPYVIFSDATLRTLARDKPTSRSQLLEIKGIGKAKLDAFGDTFLRALADSVS